MPRGSKLPDSRWKLMQLPWFVNKGLHVTVFAESTGSYEAFLLQGSLGFDMLPEDTLTCQIQGLRCSMDLNTFGRQ